MRWVLGKFGLMSLIRYSMHRDKAFEDLILAAELVIDEGEILVLIKNIGNRANDVDIRHSRRSEQRQWEMLIDEVLGILVDAAGGHGVRDVPAESRNGSPVKGS